MPAPVVIAGEALVDLVLGPDGAVSAHSGGGPYNVARTVARLGVTALYLGRLSTDRFGHRLRDQLEADGVAMPDELATDDPTTLALAELDGGGAATYRFYAEGTSAPGLTLAGARAALPPTVGVLYAGTLGLVFEPLATTVEELVAGAGERTLVALDPNCRPTAIRDPGAYRARLDRCLRRADVVKVSEEDLAWLDPGTPPADAARGLLGHERAVALVTLGPDGALVVTPDRTIAVRAPAVDVADTIGAGDAFMGAFLARWRTRDLGRADLQRADALEEAAAFACRVAAITCSRAGADPPRAAELERTTT